jgi:hypothetical protein
MILSATFRGLELAIYLFINTQRQSRGKNVVNFDPRKGGFKIIFKLREENL